MPGLSSPANAKGRYHRDRSTIRHSDCQSESSVYEAEIDPNDGNGLTQSKAHDAGKSVLVVSI